MTDVRERQYLLALAQIPKLSQSLLAALLDCFGDAETAWHKPAQWRKALSLTNARAETLIDGRKTVDPERVAQYADIIGCKLVTANEPSYPEVFRHVANAPYLLYYFGQLPAAERFGITVVGSRHCSEYGREVARIISADLVRLRDTMIVSGLAEGIDGAAHTGALEAGGYTVAVLGNGIDRVYPAIHTKLFEQIKESGCILTEYPFGMEPMAHNFPARNRLMSALGRGVLVVEGTEGSGVFHTVNHGLEQGKDVFAVPGSIFSRTSYAPHYFIREGSAKLTVSAVDILEEYFDLAADEERVIVRDTDFSNYPEEDRRLLLALAERDRSFEELKTIHGGTAPALSALLTRMEIDGLIRQAPGKIYCLTMR